MGGSNPIFAHGKNVSFPIFPHGEKWEKSIWKKREKYSFPSLSIYFFPILPMGKNGKRHIFPMGKNGVGPPHFCPWKNVCFPIFPHGEKWEKSIWKEREKYSFPSLFIYFFPMGKNGKTHNFPWAKMGLDPPPQIIQCFVKNFMPYKMIYHLPRKFAF